MQRNSWQEKTQSLNLEKDTNKLWQLTKILNGDVQERSLTVLEHNGELVAGKRAANTLAKMYKKDSETNLPRERIRIARAELKNPQKHSGKQACMTSALRMDELEEAIKQLKNKKKVSGPWQCEQWHDKTLWWKSQKHTSSTTSFQWIMETR